MLRALALILLPIALLVAACGGGSADDGAVRESADEPVGAARDAGPDGIYDTADDATVGDVPDLDEPADPPAVAIDPGDDIGPADTSDRSDADAVDDFVIDDASEPDASDSTQAVSDGSLSDNAVFGALNPFTFLGGVGGGPSLQEIDSDLGSALLTESDVPNGFDPMGEFSFSMPSEFGDMDMAARMFGKGIEEGDFGSMIMSAVMSLPPEAMDDLDELTGLTEADLAEIQNATDDFGMEFASLEILNADGLGEAGFGMHMELDFGGLFSAFGAPDDDSVPAGIAMDMYAFVVGDRVLMTMMMWPMGEGPGADGRGLAEIMASRA